ncbi:MAG TPA: PHP domain-containing protein [Clostridium sp.]|uniref:PHP domain-containing protein n=1 Tax=Clostridium sp. TaxID=1506 RepID=UPI002F93528F
MDNFTAYHVHDDTSNCNGYADSCSSYKEYIKLAKKQGMKAIAFSNHGGMYDWMKKKQDCDKAGVKYIHGIESYLCTKFESDERGYHIGLYAKNYDGVLELNLLNSKSTSKGKLDDKTDRHMYYNPRISLEELMKTSENIIVTTACLASILWRKKDDEDDYVLRFLEWMSKNSSRCFLEIQYHTHIQQIEYNKLLWGWSKQYNIPLIAGTDTHSSSKYKAECRKILQISKDSFYGDEDAFDLTWKSFNELVECFKTQNALPEDVWMGAIDNTNKLADMVEEFKLDKSFKYPNLYGDNAVDIWKKTIAKKLQYKVANKIIDIERIVEYKLKIKEEFSAMKKQNMESFMMFMAELVDHCNENDIPYGFCRGSVGGSEIAFITDITDVDPLRWNTVFSRFCNAERVSLADIDIDFAPEDRVKVYEFIINRFTPEKTAYISSFSTLRDRGTIDVLAKGLKYEDLDAVMGIKNQFDKLFDEYFKIIQEEVNLEELEEADAKSVDFDYHEVYCSRIRNVKSLTRANNLKKEFQNLKDDNKDLFYYFDGLKGTIIAKGTHPAGIIGSPITLADNLGVYYKNGDESQPVSICSMKAVDSVNFVKFDILGLKAVGIMKDIYKYVNSNYLKAHEIDWNDNKVWDNMVTSSVGVFQFEGDYAYSLLKDFKPRFINDMSLVNAALRPSGKSYRDRLIRKELNVNPSEQLDTLLQDNYGYLVYQEDTIKFLTDICGFSGSLADTTRRAIGKKDIVLLTEQLPKILEGYCNKSNKPREEAEEEVKQFLQIIDDSSEYQFGYNHSTGYSMNGYAETRLRTYYPLEFVTAYLNRSENTEDTNRGIALAQQLNIKINPISFGKSVAEYTYDKKENSIYKGIASIKFLNEQVPKELYDLAQQKEYTDFIDLLGDIKTTCVNTRQLKILTGLNFFRRFGKNKKLLQIIESYDNFASRKQINFKDITKLNINERMLQRYSNKTTETLYKELDMMGYIREAIQTIEDKPLSIKEQVKFEMEFLEYTEYINENAGDGFYIITKFETYKDKTKPYLTMRQVKTGIDMRTKIKDGKIYVENPFKLYDVLKVNAFKTQYKTKNVGGKWMKSNELEEILISYEVY